MSPRPAADLPEPSRRADPGRFADTAELQRERDRAAQVARDRSAFIGRLGHELRVPLASLLSFARLLEDDGVEPLSPRQRARVARISVAGERMQQLLEQMQDLARLDAPVPALAPPPVPVAELLRAAQAGLASVAPEATTAAGAVLRWPAPQQVSGRWQVRGERGLLLKALHLVLQHALGSAPTGATVTVMVEPPTGVDIETEPQLMLAVRVPSGEGGPPQPTLFDLAAPDDAAADPASALGAGPDRDGDRDRDRDRDGGGRPSGLPSPPSLAAPTLGLQLAQQLLQSLGGHLACLDEPGATLHLIQLPATSEAPAATSAPLHVLCVEDNAVNLLLVRELFALRPALRLSTAVDGQGGIAAACADPPDLLLLDLQLPDMHGVQVMQRLRDEPALQRCRMVAVSADAMPEHVAWARAQGFDDYWTKPLQFDQFLARLDALASSHAAAARAG